MPAPGRVGVATALRGMMLPEPIGWPVSVARGRWDEVEARIEAALARIERAILSRPRSGQARILEAGLERRTLERDCELLRAECAELRVEVDALRGREKAALEAAQVVGRRLDQVIDELDELVDTGGQIGMEPSAPAGAAPPPRRV